MPVACVFPLPPWYQKRCSGCGDDKDAESFSFKRTSPDGLHSYCRACNVRSAGASIKRNPEKARAHKRGWKERNPERVAAQHKKDARTGYWRNRVAIRARVKAQRAANAEKLRAWWKTPHGRMLRRINQQRRLARQAAAPATLTSAEWEKLVAAFDGLCAYCGEPWKEIDHVLALSRGGGLTADNVVPACGACNVSKHARSFEDFCASRGLDPAAIRARAAAPFLPTRAAAA